METNRITNLLNDSIMNNKIFSIFGLAIAASTAAFAQTSFDAALTGQQELNGTSRYVAMGGAMGALGSDISVISQNPAGLGTYRQSDFNASLSIVGAESRTNPLYSAGNPGVSGDYQFYSHNDKSDLLGNFDNVSIVLCGYDGSSSYVNFGFSYRRLANIDNNMDYIDSFFDGDGYLVNREYRDHRRIKLNSFDFNLSCNLDDVLYYGLTMGIVQIDSWSDSYFYDYYDYDVHPDYPDGFDYTCGDWSTSQGGAGVNLALGTIFRPVPSLRLGASFKSPTWYQLNVNYDDNLYALRGEPYDGEYFSIGTDYRYSSPWTLDLSAGYTAGSTAIGVEFERNYVGRSFMSVSGNRMNAQGAAQFQDYSTFRFGVEHNIDKLALRLGYCTTGSMFKADATPYLLDSDFNDNRLDFQTNRPERSSYFSLGAGFCSAPDNWGTQFYADIAFVHGVRNSKVCANEYDEDPVLKYQYESNKLQLTLGWSF